MCRSRILILRHFVTIKHTFIVGEIKYNLFDEHLLKGLLDNQIVPVRSGSLKSIALVFVLNVIPLHNLQKQNRFANICVRVRVVLDIHC